MQWLLSGIVAPVMVLMLKDVWRRQRKLAPHAAAVSLGWFIVGGAIVMFQVWSTALAIEWGIVDEVVDFSWWVMSTAGLSAISGGYIHLISAKPENPVDAEK